MRLFDCVVYFHLNSLALCPYATKVFVPLGDDTFKQTWVSPKFIDMPKRPKDPMNWIDNFLEAAPDIENKINDLTAALSECALGSRLENEEFYDYFKSRVKDAFKVQNDAGAAANWRMFREV